MRPTPLRTAARVGAILAMAAPLAVLGGRAYARLTNRPFYRAATRRIALPGLSEGFIPQDLFYCKSSKTWLFSGYMNDGSASRCTGWGQTGRSRGCSCGWPTGARTAATARRSQRQGTMRF